MDMANGNGDVFTKWIVGIAGTVVVAVGSMLLSSITDLKKDMAVVMVNTETTSANVKDHEDRIRSIEAKQKNDQDDTRVAPQYWRYEPRRGR